MTGRIEQLLDNPAGFLLHLVQMRSVITFRSIVFR